LQYAGENHVKQRVLDFSGLLHADAVAVDTVTGLTVHAVAEAGQDVQVNRQTEVLRRRPKSLIMIRGKRKFRVRHLPDHRADDSSRVFAALHFSDGMVNVVHGKQRDAVEAIRNLIAILDDPVVVSSEQTFLERRVFDAIQAETEARI